MSLFGNTNTGFGATANTGFSFTQPTGLSTATPFGAPQQTGFGSFLNTPQKFDTQQQSGLGTTGNSLFGVPQQTSFGTTQQNPFGAPQQNAFGTSQLNTFGVSQPNAFGVPQQNAFGASLQNKLGAPQQSPFGPSQLSAFGTPQLPAFGTTQTALGAPQQSPFGATNTGLGLGQPSLGFGTAQQSGFGTAQPSGFGGTTNTGLGFSQPQTAFSFQAKPAFGGSLFGTSQPSAFTGVGSQGFNPLQFGQQIQPHQQQGYYQQQSQFQTPQIDETVAFYQSIFQCNIFGDERDAVLASLNYVQACWGRGKGFYSQSFPPVTYTPDNPFFRFKTIGYSFMFKDLNEDGQVILNMKKTPSEVQAEELQMLSAFQNMFNRPNIAFKISAIKPSADGSVVILVANDKNTNYRVPAFDLTGALTQPFVKTQLDNLGIVSVIPKVKPNPGEIKLYLEKAPNGIDPRVWHQAQIENPDPSAMVPIAMIGIGAMKTKMLWLNNENEQHQARLKLIEEDLTKLRNRYSIIKIEMEQLGRRQSSTSHRILSVMGRQNMIKYQGLFLMTDEEEMKLRLEGLEKKMNLPQNTKIGLSDIKSQIKMRQGKSNVDPTLQLHGIDSSDLRPLLSFLIMQQESTKSLVNAIKQDLSNLKRISDGVSELASKVRAKGT